MRLTCAGCGETTSSDYVALADRCSRCGASPFVELGDPLTLETHPAGTPVGDGYREAVGRSAASASRRERELELADAERVERWTADIPQVTGPTDTAVCQYQRNGEEGWVDYARTTPAGAAVWVAAGAGERRRAVDWESGAVLSSSAEVEA